MFLLLLGFFRMDTVVFLFLAMSILALMQLNSNKQKIHIVYLTIATAVCLLNYVIIDEVYYDALSKEKSLGLALISMAVLTVHLILFKNNYLFTRLLAWGKRMQIVFLLIPVTGLVLFYRPDSLYNTMINLFSIRSRWSMIWWYIFIYACWKLYRVVKIKDINLVRDKFLSVFSGGNLFWLLYIFHIFFMTLLRSSYRVGFGDSGKRMFVIALFGFFAVFFTFKDGKKTELNHFSEQYN